MTLDVHRLVLRPRYEGMEQLCEWGVVLDDESESVRRSYMKIKLVRS